MKKKYEVLFYIDKLSTQKNQNNPSKMLFSTKELASYLNIQRSNLSAILNELVRENKLEKISGRPVLYKILPASIPSRADFAAALCAAAACLVVIVITPSYPLSANSPGRFVPLITDMLSI